MSLATITIEGVKNAPITTIQNARLRFVLSHSLWKLFMNVISSLSSLSSLSSPSSPFRAFSCSCFVSVISCELVVPDIRRRLEPLTHTKSHESPGYNIQTHETHEVGLTHQTHQGNKNA